MDRSIDDLEILHENRTQILSHLFLLELHNDDPSYLY